MQTDNSTLALLSDDDLDAVVGGSPCPAINLLANHGFVARTPSRRREGARLRRVSIMRTMAR